MGLLFLLNTASLKIEHKNGKRYTVPVSIGEAIRLFAFSNLKICLKGRTI